MGAPLSRGECLDARRIGKASIHPPASRGCLHGWRSGEPKPCAPLHGLLALLVPGLYAKKEALFVALAATGVEPAPGPWKANVRTALRRILDTSRPHTLEQRTAEEAATALRAWEAARTHFKHTEELLDQGLLEGMTIVRAAYLEQLERVNEYHDELVDAVLNAPSPCSN
ncbi:hypothetical protein LEL_05795 [Akanthomyces lecanii RCEF 1005]|uniref:Uncharacterized protein n=1 Tax=Akanthomyces lecanii RCEF 1005 TaxID=1081108 RepID=A0A168G713_CORDF|nr:hypothetical protein LEL_05795 [Akanthomyces lecanii RCEF 1005]